MSTSFTIDVASVAETESLGASLGEMLFPGTVVALEGQLGAGKTRLVRAIAIGLGIADTRVVSSPTFVLIQEYDARLPIYHFDAYRLPGARELDDLGAHEYFQGNGVCLVEWADRVPSSLPAEHMVVRITITGEQSRRFDFHAKGVRYEALLQALSERMSPASSPPRPAAG